MILTDQVKCNVCGALKGETNHWLVAITIPPTEEEPGEVCIAFAPIDADTNEEDVELRDGTIEHICGHACAVKRFSQWLETLTPLPTKGSSE
jgi:hypothetical protein